MVSHLICTNPKTQQNVNRLGNANFEGTFTASNGFVDAYPSSRRKSFFIGTYAGIFLLCALSALIVVLPFLHRINSTAFFILNREKVPCGQSCRFELVESIPEGLTFNETLNLRSTFDVWKDLIEHANQSVEIASFYWTLRLNEGHVHPSSKQGETIYQAILEAGSKRGVDVKIAQNEPSTFQPNPDTEYLQKENAAQVRSVNFTKLMGAGVLHTKFWIVDRKHVYVGSANMDWRALTQVKELGAVIYDCPCIAEDLGKIFDVYWYLGDKDKVPNTWPDSLSTDYNAKTPLNVTFNNNSGANLMYLSSSPPPFSTRGRTEDIDALLRTIASANKFIYISVMDYFPLSLYTHKNKYWPVIDDEIRRAIINRGVNVRILISQWRNTRAMIYNFMNSLKSLNKFNKKVTVEVKKFKVESDPSQSAIPYARVNHNKYMVTDNGVFIGTSNWSADYFIDTAGVSIVMQSNNSTDDKIRQQLKNVFERDWFSNYSSLIY